MANTFKDISFKFNVHPITGDLVTVSDVDAIRTSISNILQTNFYERLFNQDVGSSVRDILFDDYGPVTQLRLQNAIETAIANFEPRVTIDNISVEMVPDRNEYYVRIDFLVVTSNEPQVFETYLSSRV